MQEKGIFEVFNDIGEHVTLVKWIDTIGNLNHAVTIAVCWIYDSNFNRPLLLMK